MKTDNVLVSREKWESLLHCAMMNRFSHVLSMPDFLESERDVEVVQMTIEHEIKLQHADNINNQEYPPQHPYRPISKAAINALRYRKDGE